jgi:hypothetical protein
LATVPIFSHVPVTGIGLVPEATSPTDLTRSPEMLPIASSSAPFRYGRGKQLFVISIDNVTAGSTFVSVQWTVQSLTAGEGVELAQSPPFAEVAPGSAKVYNPSSASGPQVRPAGTGLATLRAQLMSSKREGLGAVECLCTDFGVWAASLQQAQQQVSVVTNLPPLPNDTQQVDVVLPGLTTLRRVPVTSATDATLRSAGPVPKRIRTWTYNSGYPPAGWSVDQWPTPVPNSRQLSRYEATVDDLVR